MVDTVTSLLDTFTPQNRDAGRQLAAMLREDPASFQRAVIQYLSKGGEPQCVPLVVWLLQKEGKLLELLLNPRTSSLEESIIVAKLVKKVVDPMDVHLAQTLKGAPEELAARVLRLLAEICDSSRTLPLLTRTLKAESRELRSKAAFIFARHCRSTFFVENALNDPDPAVRASAIQGLSVAGQIAHRHCIPMVEKLLQDSDERVREKAAEALKKPGTNGTSGGTSGGTSVGPADSGQGSTENQLTVDTLFASVDGSGRRRIYLAVSDASGDPMTDLCEKHFRVEEGGEEVSGCHVEGPALRGPLSLAYVLDSSSVSISKILEMATAVIKSIEHKQPEDRMSVYKCSFDVERAFGFTENLEHLAAAMRRPHVGVKTASRLHDAIWQALEDVIPEQGWRAVVAVAAGNDRGSDSEHALPAVVDQFRSVAVPLYVIEYGSGTARDLSSLAERAGGSFFSAEKSGELTAACQALFRRLSNRYSITYEREDKPPGPVRLRVESPTGAGQTSIEPVNF